MQSCSSSLRASAAGLLSFYSLFYTTEFQSNQGEFPLQESGSWGVVLLVMAAALLMFLLAGKLNRKLKLLLGFTCFYAAAYSLIWARFCGYEPMWDQEEISLLAGQLAVGAENLSEGSREYLAMYPHQLGLSVFLSFLYRIFGVGNFQVFQLLSGIASGLIVCLGYRILFLVTKREEPCAYFLLLMLGCHPLYIYATFVYGEVLSILCSFWAIYELICYLQRGRKRDMTLLAVSLTVACLIRSNSSIVLVAAGCILVVKAVSEKRLRHAIVFGGCCLLLFLSRAALTEYYEERLHISLQNGLPASVWVAMGLQDGEEKPGWYNGYSHYVYLDLAEEDAGEASAIGKANIAKSLSRFAENPADGADFFRRKTVSQWNEPTYASLEVTSCEKRERSRLLERVYDGDLWIPFVRVMDAYQSLIYVGAFLFLALSLGNRIPLERYVFLIVVLGGFLFYLGWEAKSRYILPYFVMMVPMAACGFDLVQQMGSRQNLRKKK